MDKISLNGSIRSVKRSVTNSVEKNKKISNFLLREITMVVSTKKTNYLAVSGIISKYTEDTIPFEFLDSKNSIVRRLSVILISLIFEQKCDIFRYKLKKNIASVCLDKNRFYLNKKLASFKKFKPEKVSHISSAILYYLPFSFYPSGLPCFINLDKLINILITKNFLALPDPKESVIWMEFGENSISIEEGNSSSASESESISQYRVHNKNLNNKIGDNDSSQFTGSISDDSEKNPQKESKENLSMEFKDKIDEEKVSDASGEESVIEKKTKKAHKFKIFRLSRKEGPFGTIKKTTNIDTFVTHKDYNHVEFEIKNIRLEEVYNSNNEPKNADNTHEIPPKEVFENITMKNYVKKISITTPKNTPQIDVPPVRLKNKISSDNSIQGIILIIQILT